MQLKQNMTPVRACQVATELLRRLDTPSPEGWKVAGITVSKEERDAIKALREIAARVATGLTGRKTP